MNNNDIDNLFNDYEIINKPQLLDTTVTNGNNNNDDNSKEESKEFDKETVELGEGEGQVKETIDEPSKQPNLNPDEIDEKPNPSKDGEEKSENVSIQHITNYSFKRANYIAKIARDDAAFIAYFRKGMAIKPVPGQKPDMKAMLYHKKFYYYPVLTEDKQEIQNLKDEIARLSEISNLKNGYTDAEGTFHPPTLRDNDRDITGLEDKEFYNLTALIQQKTNEMYQKVESLVFGITDAHKKNMEWNSFKTAMDAAIYRLEQGVVEESKNLIYS